MPKVNSRHPDYVKFFPEWVRNSACVAGEREIKAGRTAFLPMPNASDTSPENQARYEAYLQRAVFYNATSYTLENNIGKVFAVEPTSEMPTKLTVFETDVDGSGVSISQQAKQTLSKLIENSRCGLFVDYPKTEGVTTIADAESNGIRPKIILFDTTQIINWRVGTVGGLSKLTLVVIETDYISNDDQFEVEFKSEWKALRLVDNIYQVETWREGEGGFVKVSTDIPKDGNGKTLTEIPFVFVGIEANDSTVEKPILSDIASLNLAHYRDSADYQEAVYMLGQPTPWIAGLDDDWIKNQLKGKIQLGSRAILPLPQGASAGLLQPNANTLPKEAMDQKEAQMRELGAKLVEKKEVAVTATEAGINSSSENSILSACANNVTKAYARCLVWSGMFANENVSNDPTSPIFELNTEFAVARISPNEVKAVIDAYNAKLITYEEARDRLKQGGLAYVDDMLAKQEMDEQADKELDAAMKQFDAQKVANPAPGASNPVKQAPSV